MGEMLGGDTGVAVVLRAVTDDDLDAVVAVALAQDLAWWGESHGDADDTKDEVERAIAAHGSADGGTRVAVVGDTVVGVGLHFAHGQSSVAADPAHPAADDARAALIDWLVAGGAQVIDAPPQDPTLLALLAARGYLPTRSSFELERGADLGDVPRVAPPDGVEFVEYRPGIDDHDVYDTIYSVWTDVPGHTDRPFDEWRGLFVSGARFDPSLVVVARRTDGDRRVAGVSIGRLFDDVGWVMQIAVGRPDRSIGLGRALLVEVLHRLVASNDLRSVGLSVEAVNETALGLYRSVGLEPTGEWQHCTPAP
ncbi:MAG TPA: GNAT family N-acetyltransferase [Ilumatobacter sp.]|nr:GNAT family N-acetyltransferase [Ilumatobacter sp.]